MTPFEREVDAMARRLRAEADEQRRIAARLASPVERAAAITHGNVKEAVANELRRLMWSHGIGSGPAATGGKP